MEEWIKSRSKVKYIYIFFNREACFLFVLLSSCGDGQLSGILDNYSFCSVLGIYYMIEVSSVQEPCLSVLKPSGSSGALYCSYVQNKHKR